MTGANKGIGLAIVNAILSEHDDTFVFLGARDLGRGRAAAESLASPLRDRTEVVSLDVSDDRSVAAARARIAETPGRAMLYGLVNNAGVMNAPLADVFAVNTLGVARVCEAFIPLLEPNGRVVNITSASGPTFVASCSAERRRFFQDPSVTWPALRAFIDECVAIEGDAAAFAARGLGDGSPYGLSKACANLYTLMLAREHPTLRVNACTPGFIETDMTRHYAESQHKSPAELGMKAPSAGAKAPTFLLFGELEGNGFYYGSDAQRSPLDRYRAPGSAPFAGP